MKKYVAFLRAINVGGTTIIRMADLKKMFEFFGLENVQTYIQTGNVIFESAETRASRLEEQIERQLEKASGKPIRVFVRTIKEVAALVEDCPFKPGEGETAHVVILDKKPAKKNIDALIAQQSKADEFAVKGKTAFNLRRDREASVFSNNFIEKVLGVSGTTRNLTTIKKLAEK
ncbi:MAG TPA: DUF1697 domain-containing protein [Anaerolineales bacterium]|nr:DUF1697 domain-containing protein [Anaerolineales bacterium]